MCPMIMKVNMMDKQMNYFHKQQSKKEKQTMTLITLRMTLR